jgi:acetyl esterase
LTVIESISPLPGRTAQPEAMALKVAQSAEQIKPLSECTAAEGRAHRAARGNPFAPAPCAGVTREELTIDAGEATIRGRLYRPGPATTPQNCLVYYHGGGYVIGDLDTYDTLMQQVAAASGCVVVSVEYRLAPEVKSRQIFADGLGAYRWVRTHSETLGIDAGRIAIGGDSAGGNLTIAVALQCRDNHLPMPAFQVLIYPATDYSMRFASVDEFARGYFLTKANMCWFRDHFLEDNLRISDPLVSPIGADLHGLPPAFVLTAGFDPLRDEGFAFAQRLIEHGVKTEHVCYTDMIHAFLSFAGGIEPGMTAVRQIGTVLQQAIRS